jgi:hypothetical protein
MKDAAILIRDLEQELLKFTVDRDGTRVILLPGDIVIVAEDRKRQLRLTDLIDGLWLFAKESQ